MKAPVQIGAVGYLNARPLTWALDADPQKWAIRYDLPSVCSSLLHAGSVDLGLVPHFFAQRLSCCCVPYSKCPFM